MVEELDLDLELEKLDNNFPPHDRELHPELTCCPTITMFFLRIVTNRYFGLYDIFLIICLLPDLVLSALSFNDYIQKYQIILLGLITFNTFLKVLGLNKYYIKDRMNCLDIIYIGSGWCIFEYPAVSVFRLLYIFKIIKSFRLIRRFEVIRTKLYRFLFILSQVYKEFTYEGTAIWIFLLTYIVTHIYAISSQILFNEQLPELFGNYNKSMFTLIRFSTSQEWGDILKVMEIYGNEYFFFFLSFYIIIIVGFLNGLIVVFGNAFTNDVSFNEMMELEDEKYYEENNMKAPIPKDDNNYEMKEQLNELKSSINLICDKLNINEYDEYDNLNMRNNIRPTTNENSRWIMQSDILPTTYVKTRDMFDGPIGENAYDADNDD